MRIHFLTFKYFTIMIVYKLFIQWAFFNALGQNMDKLVYKYH